MHFKIFFYRLLNHIQISSTKSWQSLERGKRAHFQLASEVTEVMLRALSCSKHSTNAEEVLAPGVFHDLHEVPIPSDPTND